MRRTNKTIGVLGGMGPQASSMLYQKIITYTQNHHGAVQDTDYPPVFINSLPLYGFDETGIRDDEKVVKQLVEGVKKLELAGSDLVIIACNTVHYFYDEMQNAIDIPIFNIIKETAQRVHHDGINKVGLLASESTCKLGLYQDKMNPLGIDVILPGQNQQDRLNNIIEQVMGGRQNDADHETLKKIAGSYMNQGAEAVILGCTELPLVMNRSQTDIRLYNSVEIIVQSAVDYSLESTI